MHSALRWKTDNHQFCILREDSCAQNFLHSPARVLSQFKSIWKTMRNTLTKSYKPLSRAYSCLQDDPARNSLESSEKLFSVFNSEIGILWNLTKKKSTHMNPIFYKLLVWAPTECLVLQFNSVTHLHGWFFFIILFTGVRASLRAPRLFPTARWTSCKPRSR